MIIPSKHSGYQAGIRVYPMGGGGGGGGPTEVATPSTPAPPPPPSNPWDKMAVNTQQGYNTLQGMRGTPWGQSGNAYNELLNQGFTSGQIKESAGSMYGAPSDANWGALVQNAGMTSPTGRPMAGSDQFFQPIYQTQYQDYNMGNPMSISQYGQQPSYGGFGGYGGGYGGGMGGYGGGFGGFGGGMGGYMPQMQTPFNPYMNQYQSPFSYQQQPSQPNYGPRQPIVSRSAQARGTPNVMRRAEGGIASLMDDAE